MLKDSLSIFGSRVAASGATLLVGVIIARKFGPEGQGQYAVVLATVLFLQLFSELGLTYSNVLHLGQGSIDVSAVMSVSIYFAGGASLLLVTLAAILLPFLRSAVFDHAPLSVILIGLASLPAITVGASLNAINLARQRIFRFNIINLLHGLLNLALVVVFVFGLHWKMRAVMVAWLLACVIFLVAAAVSSFDGVDGRTAFSPRTARNTARILLSQGFRGQLGNIAQFMNNRFDQLLVSAWLGSSQLGIYVAAVSVGEAFRFLPNAINTMLLTRVAAADEEHAQAMTIRALKFTAAFATLWAVAMIVSSGLAIRLLYGETYQAAILPTRILVPGVALLMTSAVLGAYLAGRGRVMLNSWVTIAGLAVTGVLDVLLIPYWGIKGAAAASLVSYCTGAFFTFVLYSRVVASPSSRGLSPIGAEAH